MKRILSTVVVTVAACALLPTQAWANPQHERMKRCSQEAKSQALKGDERKQFMSTCLRGKHEAAAPAAAAPAANVTVGAAAGAAPAVQARADLAAPRDRSKECNQAATEQSLTGEKRKTFISECLKG